MVKNFSTWITFSPGSDGNSSGLFTPSRRALAGSVGRNNGDTVRPAKLYIADRREILLLSDVTSLLIGVADSGEECVIVDGNGDGVNAAADTASKATADDNLSAMVVE